MNETTNIEFDNNGIRATACKIASVGRKAMRWRCESIGLEIEFPTGTSEMEIISAFEFETQPEETAGSK